MSIYGEGSYECPSCGVVSPGIRDDAQLREQHMGADLPELRALDIDTTSDQ